MQESYGIGKEEGLATALILDHYLERGEEPDDDESFHASYRGVPINLWVASSNIFKVKVANQRFANVYDILKREKLVVTLSALEEMERRWREV
jgi:large subunit ribosomal protein L4